MNIPQLQKILADAHTEFVAAQESRQIAGAAFNKAECALSEACRNRYVADKALSEALFAASKDDFQV
jgi:hypothetical protein